MEIHHHPHGDSDSHREKKFKEFLSLFVVTLIAFFCLATVASAQNDSLVLKDVTWDKNAPAGMNELFIPSGDAMMAGFIYRPDGTQKHPTLIMLHGYPGNERNLDMAQVVRAHGWNVIYFDYRGSWGSGGQFSFTNCIQDVINLVSFCKKYSDSLGIDTSNIVLFGHSMGGWVCLKALAQLPGIKKGFALSTWDIYADFKDVKTEQQMMGIARSGGNYFVLNTPLKELFEPVVKHLSFYKIQNDTATIAGKQIIMLDEHNGNKDLAEMIRASNHNYFDYEVWQTDHPFTNKRISLINKILAFLDR